MNPIVVKIGGSALGNHDTTSVPNQPWLNLGIPADHGSAQRMFVKRGYIPDGAGLRCAEKGLVGEFST